MYTKYNNKMQNTSKNNTTQNLNFKIDVSTHTHIRPDNYIIMKIINITNNQNT